MATKRKRERERLHGRAGGDLAASDEEAVREDDEELDAAGGAVCISSSP